MKNYKLSCLIYPVIIFFLNTSPPLEKSSLVFEADSSKVVVYLVKQQWHTGIVFSVSEVDTTIFPEVIFFENLNNIDIGWGDEAFYQDPGFKPELAYRALFHQTSSTLKIKGFDYSLNHYAQYSDIAVRFETERESFDNLCKLIHNKFYLNEGKSPVILSEKNGGRIKFFKAKGKYHLFNTCNTWVAEVFKKIGLDISDDIILTEQLFNEVQVMGKVVKVEE